MNAFTYTACLANAYAKISLPGLHINNLFAELQLLFNCFFITLSPAAGCFDGFCKHAIEEGLAKDGVYK